LTARFIFVAGLLFFAQQASPATGFSGSGPDVVLRPAVEPQRLGLDALECLVDIQGQRVQRPETGWLLAVLVAKEDLELLAAGSPGGFPSHAARVRKQLAFIHSLKLPRGRRSFVLFPAYPEVDTATNFPDVDTLRLVSERLMRNTEASVFFECPDSILKRYQSKRAPPEPGLYLYEAARLRYRLLGFPLRVATSPDALQVIARDIASVLSGRKPASVPLPLSQSGYDLDRAFSDLPGGRLLVLPLTGMEADPALAKPIDPSPNLVSPDQQSWLQRVAFINRGFLEAATPLLKPYRVTGVGLVLPLHEGEAALSRLKARWPDWRFLVLPKDSATLVRYWELQPLLTDSQHRVRARFFYAVRRGATLADTEAQLRKLLDEVYGR